jgi:hypothetical protein
LKTEQFSDEILMPSIKDCHYRDYPEWYTWLSENINFEMLIAASKIIYPDFIEYQDGVFLKHTFSEKTFKQWKANNYSIQELEQLMNHEHLIHILDVPLPSEIPTEEQLICVGDLLLKTWDCKLKNDFKNKKFEVELIKGDSTNLMDYQITFFQI